MENKIVCTNYLGYQLNVFNNDGIGLDVISGKVWEPHIFEFLRKNLKKDSVFLDIGSNYGCHSIALSDFCDKILSFEPQKKMFQIQKLSISQNNISNIEVFNVALGKENKDTKMNPINYDVSWVNIGDLSLGSGGEEVQMRSLDSLELNKVDFMKIDVQGYEKFVIEGSINTINNQKPILIVEFEEVQLNKFSYTSKNLFDFIRSLDYEIYFLDYTYPSDHVCVHKSKIEEFERHNSIYPLTESNNLNMNKENGVTKKIITN